MRPGSAVRGVTWRHAIYQMRIPTDIMDRGVIQAQGARKQLDAGTGQQRMVEAIKLVLVMERALPILPIVRSTKQRRWGRGLCVDIAGSVLYLFSQYEWNVKSTLQLGVGQCSIIQSSSAHPNKPAVNPQVPFQLSQLGSDRGSAKLSPHRPVSKPQARSRARGVFLVPTSKLVCSRRIGVRRQV